MYYAARVGCVLRLSLIMIFIVEFHGSDSEVSAQAEFVKDIVEQYGGHV